MRAPYIDPLARTFLASLTDVEKKDVLEDLVDLEAAAADPSFEPEDFGIPVPDEPDIFVTRVGRGGTWWVYWRRALADPPPLRHVHVLLIEPAPPAPIL